MKIGIVCYPTFGGSGILATELGLALGRKGHEVHFITYNRPVRLNNYCENVYYHEVTTVEYPLFEQSIYETALTSKLVDVVRFENLDILHVHYAIPHASIAYLAKQILKTHNIHIPIVTTLHGTDITLVGKDEAFSPVVTFSINESDGVTVVSNSLKNDTISLFNITREIEVIYNFIDFQRFKKTDKEHFKKAIAPEGERILVHVSNFRKVKRVEDVLHIFYRVKQQLPAKLLLIGDGPERSKLESLCRELHLCDDVRFLGKQGAVEELLAIADLLLIPSEHESFGLAALEAMACQVPVISTNTGGLPEVNIHGVTGFLSDVGDVDDMANNALQILKDDTILNKFRKQAALHAEKFDINNILPKYESYYEQLIKACNK